MLPKATALTTNTARTPLPANNTQLPDLPADLIYISTGEIWRWDHEEKQSVELINAVPGQTMDQAAGSGQKGQAQIESFSIDAAQRSLAVSISRGIAANGVALYDLGLVDLDKNLLTYPITQTRRIDQLQFSPDGRWLSYMTQDELLKITFLPVNRSDEKSVHWECACDGDYAPSSVSWTRDSRKAAWSDQSGIWVYAVDQDSPQLLIESKIAVPDRSGEIVEIQVAFLHPVWSPHGRYMLAEVQPVRTNAHWTVFFDTLTDRIAEVPDTYMIGDLSTESKTGWLADGRVLVIETNDPSPGLGSVRLYSVYPASDQLLMPDDAFTLEFPGTRLEEGQQLLASEDVLHTMKVVDSRYVSLVIGTTEEGAASSHVFLDIKYRILKQLGQAPHDILAIHWTENARGVLLLGKHGAMIYQSRDGTLSYDLYPLFGEQASDLLWFDR